MATTIWQPIPADGVMVEEPTGRERGTSSEGIAGLLTVRKLVDEILDEPGSHHPESLTDEEWQHLCHSAGRDSTEREAVSRLLVAAYGVRDGRTNLVPTAPPTERWDPVPVQGHQAQGMLPPEPPDLDLQDRPIDELIPLGFASPLGLPPADTVEHPSSSGVEVVEAFIEVWTSVAGDGEAELAPDGPEEAPVRRRRRRGMWSLPFRSGRSGAHSGIRVHVMEERRRQTLLTVASWVRNIGAILLLFVAWQLWGTAIQQHHTQAALRSQFAAKVDHAPAKPAPGFSLVPATTAIPDPPQGTVMAELQIPKISLQQFVVSGTNEGDLNKGPGHYLGTAMPGQAGNVAIAGHRTTHGAPFNRLAELAVGDPIYLTAANGERLTYIVSAVPVAVSPRDVTVLNNFGDNRLTLTTCNPEYSAIQRLIVVAAFLPPGVSQPPKLAKGSGKTYALTPSVTTGWNMSLLPWLTLELVVLVALGLFFTGLSRVYGRSGRWLILVPVWLALLLATFETLTNFLPAAV